MSTGKQNKSWCFRRAQTPSWTKTATVVGWWGRNSRNGRVEGKIAWRRKSLERTKAHEAGMTSLGLTFHSRPTPALCILTSLRCVSYILYLPCNPVPPPSPLYRATVPLVSYPSHPFCAFHCPAGFLENKKKEKREREREIRRYDVQIEQPPISWTTGMLVSSCFRQQM